MQFPPDLSWTPFLWWCLERDSDFSCEFWSWFLQASWNSQIKPIIWWSLSILSLKSAGGAYSNLVLEVSRFENWRNEAFHEIFKLLFRDVKSLQTTANYYKQLQIFTRMFSVGIIQRVHPYHHLPNLRQQPWQIYTTKTYENPSADRTKTHWS